jgi:hypothetical protein
MLLVCIFGFGETTQTAQTTQAPAVAAPAVTQASWSADALEELLAPIALYPDQLLAQILAASINSQEVLDGGNWLIQNQNLTGKDLDAAAQKAGFGPAMRALLPFPTVVDMMCEQIDWTKQLGSAFSSDQKSVLDAVQRLRKEAADVGNLKSTPQQKVTSKSEGGNVYIEVQPAQPQIIYVPQYDSQAVYTTPPPQAAPATTTTTVVKEDDDDTEKALAAGLIGFMAGIAVGAAVNDDYYYPHWGHGMYYGPRPFYPPAYMYRPVYGPAFRPAYGYNRPVNYRNNYNNVRVNNININSNNRNYYNRFNNNQNLRTGSARSPLANSPSRTGQPRAANNANLGKGQSTYAGARNTATNTRPTAATQPSANTRQAQPRSSTTAARADRGYDNSARSTTSRPATTNTASRPTSQPSASTRDSAFSSAQSKNSGSFQRSASARGNASVGSRPTSAGRVRR